MSDIVVEPVFGILIYTRFGFVAIKLAGIVLRPLKLVKPEELVVEPREEYEDPTDC